jgi:hypothetical protein
MARMRNWYPRLPVALASEMVVSRKLRNPFLVAIQNQTRRSLSSEQGQVAKTKQQQTGTDSLKCRDGTRHFNGRGVKYFLFFFFFFSRG